MGEGRRGVGEWIGRKRGKVGRRLLKPICVTVYVWFMCDICGVFGVCSVCVKCVWVV